MAALEVPWMGSMTDIADSIDGVPVVTGEPPTFAAFSPASASSAFPHQRSTILIHQKSPLLLATPPQITRALAYAYPFLVPLSKLAGLLSWSTHDPWESFLLLASFWAITLYGDVVLRCAGPLILAIGLMLGMYSRRFSALSTNSMNSSTKPVQATHSRQSSEANALHPSTRARHHKSLDEIVANLQTLTARCNILLEPLIRLTDFLSTQRTATSSTTSPALTTLFIRLLLITPIWVAGTLPPLRIITTKRVILTLGTLAFSWHSRPARVSRIILWRSRLIRRIISAITGLTFAPISTDSSSTLASRAQDANTKRARALARSASSKNLSGKPKPQDPTDAIRFTFTLYENQRRWLGIGWTASMLAYERAPWTDEESNPTPPKEAFQLPSVDGGIAVWRWCDAIDATDTDASDTDSGWRVEVEGPGPLAPKGAPDPKDRHTTAEDAWVYTDTKWRFPRRGVDGWGKYTRRRRWVRDAELVDSSGISSSAASSRPGARGTRTQSGMSLTMQTNGAAKRVATEASRPGSPPTSPRKSWFGRKKSGSNTSGPLSLDEVALSAAMGREKGKAGGTFSISSSIDSSTSNREGNADDGDGYIPLRYRGRQGQLEADWGVGEDAGMELG